MSISLSAIDSLLARADEILTCAITKRKVAGLGIGIVYKDKVIYTKGYGSADVAQRRLVTPETIFRTYSISKTLTAIGLIQLWEQGAFQLDDPVKRYLKAFSLEPPTAHDPPITFRHLLTHTAGLGMPLQWQRNTLEAGVGDPLPPLSRYFAGGLRAEVPAGSTFSYSNRGFAVLGQLIEDISGELYAQYMHRHVLEPLGMMQSDYVRSDRVEAQMAQGYRLSRGKLIPVAYREVLLKAAGGLLSNANDMTKYIIALLNGGSNGHSTILRSEALELMLQGHYEADEQPPMKMGLAFRLDRIGSHRVAYHSGGETGFLSSMFIAPDDGLGMIILSNTQVEIPYQPEFIIRTLLSDLWDTGDMEDTGRKAITFQKPELPETQPIWSFLRGDYGFPFWKSVVLAGFAGASLLLGFVVWRKLQRLARERSR